MLNPRAIALQGIGYSLTPIMLAVFGLLPEDENEPPPPAQPPLVGGWSGAPWRWTPYAPVKPRRPRKKRDTDLLFL